MFKSNNSRRSFSGSRGSRNRLPSRFGANPSRGGGSRGFGSRPSRQRYNKVWSQDELLRIIDEAAYAKPVKAAEVYTPSFTFDQLEINKQIKDNIISKGYLNPTAIQDKAIPAILSGLDVIGIANTGTGKTAAFLIPLIDKAFKHRNQKVIIITPTRELAFQINDEFMAFSKGLGLRAAVCIGGGNMFGQKRQLRQNPQFVIGTPGRIKDFIQQGVLDLSDFNNVVLDETDRMVDIGFINEIKFFISKLPATRQSLFFSATVAPKVQGIIQSFVNDPVTVSVKQRETAENVTQSVIKVSRHEDKLEILHETLVKEQVEKAVVFGKTKWGVQKLSDELIRRGFKAGAIHGDKRQNQRQNTLNQFKRSEITILIATDVAARGLDIADVSHVINYEMPESYDDYVHRIGRTGRANKKGKALTFIN